MSQTDSFVDEVNEELRRDQLFATLRKWGPVAVLAVVLVVGYAAWSEWQSAKARARAEAYGDAIYAALEPSDPQARADALAGVAPAGPVATLLRAAALQEAGATEEAQAVLAAAPISGAPARIADLLALKQQMFERDPAVLAELAQPGRPYRLLASEQLAMVALEAGDADAAIATARKILNDAEVTPGLRDRMETLIVAMGGTLDAE